MLYFACYIFLKSPVFILCHGSWNTVYVSETLSQLLTGTHQSFPTAPPHLLALLTWLAALTCSSSPAIQLVSSSPASRSHSYHNALCLHARFSCASHLHVSLLCRCCLPLSSATRLSPGKTRQGSASVSSVVIRLRSWCFILLSSPPLTGWESSLFFSWCAIESYLSSSSESHDWIVCVRWLLSSQKIFWLTKCLIRIGKISWKTTTD